VGSLLAIYLAQRGHRVEVWERRADLRKGGFARDQSSINLSLCERGFRALERVKIKERVRDLAVPLYGRLIHGMEAAPVFQPYGERGEASYSILRNALNRVLIDYAEQEFGVAFHFGEKCLDIDLQNDVVQFEDTRTGCVHHQKGSVIFGADGAFSGVRTRLLRTRGFNYSQQYLDHGYLELNIPSVPEGRWPSPKPAVHLWPRVRYMLLGLPNLDGSLVCSLHLPLEGESSFASLTDGESVARFLRDSFPDVADLMPRAADEFFSREINHLVSVRCFPWVYEGRLALIGDAAHAVVPFYAQGVNAGFEDCLVLDECLDDCNDDWSSALRAFERRRKPDADAVSDLSLQHFVELRDHVGQARFQLKKRIERKLAELYPDWFVPLYSIVTFTAAPYSEALRRGCKQEAFLEKILTVPEIFDSSDPELTRLIQQVVEVTRREEEPGVEALLQTADHS
jgi:kynurenine 3-monooxygenase